MLPVGRLGLYALLVALPIAIEIPPDSTGRNRGNTRITAIGGGGTYSIIERGCDNQVIRTDRYEYREAAGAIEHEFPSGLAVGVRGGMIRQSNETSIPIPTYGYPYSESTYVVRGEYNNEYIQPTIALEKGVVGIGAGWIWSREPFANGNEFDLDPGPSFHLRIGRRDAVRLEFNYMENLPLYSGGGYAELGIGMHPHRLWDFSMSMSAAPFDDLGMGIAFDYRVLPNWSVLGRARIAGGAAIGISYSTRPPLPPHRKPKRDSNDVGWRGGLEAKRPKEPPPVMPPPAPAAPAAPAVAIASAPLPAVEKYPKYGDYQALDSLAVPLLRAEPVTADTTTGTVSVAALVDWNGNVVETRVIRSIPALDQAAIECASRWTFRPAISRGRRVASWVTIPVRF